MEVTAGSEITAIHNGADVSPLRVHRTGCVDNEGKFDLATTGVVPSDLDVIVGVNNHIGVALVTDDWREKGVVKQRDDGTDRCIGLEHCVVDLGLVEETLEFVIGVFPNDVRVALAVQIDGGPVAVLRAHGHHVVVNGADGSIVTCGTIHWSGPRIEDRVDDFVLAGFVGPNNVNAVHVVDGHVRVPNLVESGIRNLSGVNEGLASWRKHGVVEVEVVSSPDDVNVSFAVRGDGCLLICSCSTVNDLNRFCDDNGVC